MFPTLLRALAVIVLKFAGRKGVVVFGFGL